MPPKPTPVKPVRIKRIPSSNAPIVRHPLPSPRE
jgi:hypothetical protein